jgi:ubiquinone/menaquinone biosynthesis C-methylase UbiE
MATRFSKNIVFHNGDAYQLPYASNIFDFVFCHYFLLWITSPDAVLQEILRVLKPGGRFLAFAEPDYAARIDAPAQLESLGILQTNSLINQGVNPRTGRNLPALVTSAGFCQCQYGISSYEQVSGDLPEWWESEWEVIAEDLKSFVDPEKLALMKIIDHDNWLSGIRVLWIPTFYLSCIKPL